jgi:hypothetical protein
MIRGSYLLLDEEQAWNHIDKRMRTAIRKAATFGPRMIEVQGSEENIKIFAEFCPRADTLPEKLTENQRMFFAYIGEELVAGLIVVEIAGNWFLQFNAVTESARKKQMSSWLMWEVVKFFSKSKYRYLDVGANYRGGIQKFFEGWRSREYPIMMKPPEIKPLINITPFDARFLDVEPGVGKLEDIFKDKEYTVFPRGMYAIFALIKWLKLEGKINADDEICIKTTSGSPYISGCVTSAIEQTCKWSREISEKTKAIFAIHEFGFVNPEIENLRKICDEKHIPLIEDFAYLFNPDVKTYGDYLIFSMTKIFPMQFGGILVGKKFEPEYIWNNFACYDGKKEELVRKHFSYHLSKIGEYNKKRLENYNYFLEIFGEERVFFKLDGKSVPGAFVLKVENEERARQIAEYVRKFGIECGVYHKNSAVFFPLHQNLNKPQLDYVAGAVLAMFRNGNGIYDLPVEQPPSITPLSAVCGKDQGGILGG